MNKALVSVVVMVAVVVGSAVVYLAVPSLGSDQARVDAEVQEHVERARRLMADVGENEERLAVVLEGLHAAGVPDLSEADLTELVEGDRELLVDAEDRLRQIRMRRRAENQRLQQRIEGAGGEPAMPMPDSFGRNVPQMVAAIRDGLAAQQELLNANRALLDQAHRAAQEAVSVSSGEVTGQNHPLAQNMLGVVLYAQGTALHRQAQPQRRAASGPRSRLQTTAAELVEQAGEGTLAEHAGLDDRIAQAEQEHSRRSAALAEQQAEIAALAGRIADREARLTEQKSIADRARIQLDALVAEGMDLTDPDGLQKFADAYGAQSLIYRQALREAQILEFGTLDNATIDASGDYVTGQYLPETSGGSVEAQPGVFHLQGELADLQARAAKSEELLASIQNDIEAGRAAQQRLVERVATAARREQDLETQAGEALTELTEAIDEAMQTEDNAIAKLTAAERAFKAAARGVQSRQSDVGETVENFGSEARQRSALVTFAEDRRLPASANARAADAKLRLAMVYYDRYRDLHADRTLLGDLADTLGLEVDLEDLDAQLEVAQADGLAAAQEASDILFRESRTLDQHFAITAQIAAAYCLEAGFDAPGRLAAGIENYRLAVEGREDSPFVRTYVERLEQLERLQSP
ncbi:MAG: hypothetical protein GY778_24225 [bacterium]|nr:hypothetical protein [bacterium]